MKLFEDEEYDGALFELNKAMGMLKHKYSHPLRAEVEKQIRIDQGKNQWFPDTPEKIRRKNLSRTMDLNRLKMKAEIFSFNKFLEK